MTANLRLKIISPTELVFDGNVTAVTIPAEMGEMQVLKGHIPVVARLTENSRITAFKGNTPIAAFEVDEGLFRVTHDDVNIIVDQVLSAEILGEDN